MTTRLVLAAVHLLALGVGLAGVWARARALRDSLRNPEDPRAISRALAGDAWWGVAAVLWLSTGLWRLLGATEKSTGYYLENQAFRAKLGLFLVIFALEIWPMLTLIAWRRKTKEPNARDAGRIEIISYVECVLVVVMVFTAVTMARGFGMKGTTLDVPPVAPTALTTPAATPTLASGEAADARKTDNTMAVAPPIDAVAPVADTMPTIEPTGTETVTGADIALLTREMSMPIDGINAASLKSNFDERRGGGTRPHEALDIMSARGTPVKAAASGRVLKLFTSKAGGLMVYAADSSERFILMYAHLDSYAAGIRDGSVISRGQVIGYVGSTGNANAAAPHLHFAIARSADVKRWSKGKPVDPLPVLQAASR